MEQLMTLGPETGD
jgi:predicted  nucleic acid-binding Zn-ribbon protein